MKDGKRDRKRGDVYTLSLSAISCAWGLFCGP